MKKEEKDEIRSRLAEHCARYPSNAKAAASLRGVSQATLSNILNGKWESISDDMFRRLDSQLASLAGWRLHETAAFRDVTVLLEEARAESAVMWIAAPAGIGKTTAAAWYAAGRPNVYRLTCASDMTRSDFVHELASQVGVRTRGMGVRESFRAILRHVVTLDRPLLVFDEADKLADSVMYYFISIYNALEDRCGIVFMSTAAIKRRMQNGILRDRKGYDEMESRICRRYVDLTPVSAEEVAGVCEANGLLDAGAVRRVRAEAAGCGNDLRRVKRSVRRELRLAAMAASAARGADAAGEAAGA